MSDEKPLPVPEGMTKEQVEKMTVNEGKWRPITGFVCATCENAAFGHPYTNHIWGCKTCDFTTYSVSVYFKKQEPSFV